MTVKAYIKRQSDDGIQTLGILFFETIGGTKTFATLELPWKDNQRSISCIPKGNYQVKTTYSNKYKKDMWQIMDVPNRSGVRIHGGNYYFQIEGCILLGLSREDINNDGKLDMINSQKAIALAKHYLGKEFELEIL